MNISAIIEAAAALIPNSLYLRATDIQANIEIDDLEIGDKIVVLYNNLPTVKNRVTQSVQREVPVEIKILKLGNVDDNDVDGDAIRASLVPAADLMFDATIKNPEHSLTRYADTYEIDFLNQVKIYDDVLTGLVLKYSMFFDRSFFCIPEPEPTPEP